MFSLYPTYIEGRLIKEWSLHCFSFQRAAVNTTLYGLVNSSSRKMSTGIKGVSKEVAVLALAYFSIFVRGWSGVRKEMGRESKIL